MDDMTFIDLLVKEVYCTMYSIEVVMALLRSQLSPKVQNAREKEGANGKMLWWKWCDAPFGESRAWKSNIRERLTGRSEMW